MGAGVPVPSPHITLSSGQTLNTKEMESKEVRMGPAMENHLM